MQRIDIMLGRQGNISGPKRNQLLKEKEAELFKPIQDKAMKAINDVAKEQGYQYVLDRATLIVADGKDILEDVKKKMGI